MPATAVTYGTEIWLAALVEAGWTLTVSESRRPEQRVVLRQVEDDFEPMELLAPARVSVGVLAVNDQGDGAFVPCASEVEARSLLERVLAEAWE